MFRDDDDELPDPSSAEYLTRADHGKAEAQGRKAERKGLLLTLKRALLRQQVDGKKTPNQAMRDEASADAREEKAATDEQETPEVQPIGTQSTQDEAKADVQDASKKDDAESLLKKEKSRQDAKSQTGEEYQQNMS